LIKREIRKPKFFMEQDQAAAAKTIQNNQPQDNLSILAATASTQNSHLLKLLCQNVNVIVSLVQEINLTFIF
jgi:hypothetical protein